VPNYWARELTKLGHEVRLMPAKDVKAYVKRNKNDAADAEAICEAFRRPTMRFVRVKSAEQQGRGEQAARNIRGLHSSWRGVRSRSSRSRWPIKWRASRGPYWPRVGPTGRLDSRQRERGSAMRG
jgi:hypothetical protein